MTTSTTPAPVGLEMTHAEMVAELHRLKEELAKKKAGVAPRLSFKVSEKGALSVYGMGRFPVTLYAEQWVKLLDLAEDIRAFILANKAKLTTKEQSVAAKAAAEAKS